MSISDQITRLTNAKAVIKQSIENKGVDVSDTALLDEYPALIDKIEGSGEGGADPYYEQLYMQRTVNGTNMKYLFAYSSASTFDLSKINTSNATTMESMFQQCQSLTSLDVNSFDTNNVTTMGNMFSNCSLLTSLNASNWDTSNVTDMVSMFRNCNKLTSIDASNWDTSNVTDMTEMFRSCFLLKELIIPNWDMTNIINSSGVFSGCYDLNYIDLSRSNDVTIAKIVTLVPKKTLDTYGQILIPVDSSQENIEALAARYWKPIGPRLDMTSCEIATELDEIKPGKSTKLYYGNSEPWYGNNVNVEYVSSDESVATIDEETMMVISTGIEGITEITARIADTQEVISVAPITLSVSATDSYPNVIKFRGTSTPANNNYIRVNDTNVKLSAMNYNSLSGIYTYDVGAPITSIQFNGYGNTSYANTCTDVVKINTSNVTNMYWMFRNCSKLTQLDASNFDTSNVTRMNYMFSGCESLTQLDVSNWVTSNVTTMSDMFYNCNKLTELDLSNFDTSNVTDMFAMFYNCTNLTELNVSNFDTSNVTYMGDMFSNCNKLHTLRLDNCNNDTIKKIITSSGFPINTISDVTRKIYCRKENTDGLKIPTNWVFIDCVTEENFIPKEPEIAEYVQGQFQDNGNLTEVNTVVTSSHTDLSYMFDSCYNLQSVNTQDWDVSNVYYMNNMFNFCSGLYSLDLSNWSPNAVYDMSYMFRGCSNLNSLSIGYWYLSSAQNMNNMFADCSSLYSLDLSGFDGTYNLQDTSYMFYNCNNLSELYLNYFDMSQVWSTDCMFSGCSNLTYLHLDYCNYDTVEKIITSSDFPEWNSGIIYCSSDVYNSGLTPPGSWTFEVVW